MLIYFEEGFRSFHTFDIGSVGQRSAKLLVSKVEISKKVCTLAQVEPHVFGMGSTPTGSESFSKFEEQQLCSPLTYLYGMI